MNKFKKIITLFLTLVIVATSITVPTVEVQAATIKLSATSISITVGSKKTLSVKNTSKTVKWSSNKKSVATVSSKGVVKGKKAGTATITAKVGNKKLTCKVTVSNVAKNNGNNYVQYGSYVYYIVQGTKTNGKYKYRLYRIKTDNTNKKLLDSWNDSYNSKKNYAYGTKVYWGRI